MLVSRRLTVARRKPRSLFGWESADTGSLPFPCRRVYVPHTIRKLPNKQVYLVHSWRRDANELVSLSTVSCTQISPALTDPLSTGDRRVSEACKLAIPSVEAPKAKAGEKGELCL
jgi:hypothetical protein